MHRFPISRRVAHVASILFAVFGPGASLAAQFTLCDSPGSAAGERAGIGLAAIRTASGASLVWIGAPQGSAFGQQPNTGTVHVRNAACVSPPPFFFPLSSSATGDEFGARLAAAGNGVIAIGAAGYDGPAGANSGFVRIVDATTGIPVATLFGDSAGERFGSGIKVGDIDGDGVPDYVVGSPDFVRTASCSGISNANRTVGRTSVWSGATNARLGWIEGTWHCSFSPVHPREGRALDVLGDVDGDGRAEILIGSPAWSQGQVHVVSFATGVLQRVRTISGGASFGSTVAALDDLDGDQIPDFAVGAPTGRQVTLHSGATGAPLPLSWTGVDAEFGATLANVGDQDADGVADLLIGAPGADGARGAVYVFSPAQGRLLAVLRGNDANERFGAAACAVPDWTGAVTPAPEIAIGAPGAASDQGRASVVSLAIDAAPAQAYWARVGAACAPAGTSGILPNIGTPNGAPVAGSARFSIAVATTVPGTQAFVFLGSATLPAPFCLDFVGMPSCCLQILPWDAAVPVPTQSPTTQIRANAGYGVLTIPLAPSVPAGVRFYAQAYVMDPGSVVFPGTMTAALSLVTH